MTQVTRAAVVHCFCNQRQAQTTYPCAAPTGHRPFIQIHPTLKRWAKICYPVPRRVFRRARQFAKRSGVALRARSRSLASLGRTIKLGPMAQLKLCPFKTHFALRSPEGQHYLQPGEELAHALQPALQFLTSDGVRHANVLLCSKGFAGHHHHVRLVQQLASDIAGRIHAAAAEVVADVGIGIERAVRRRASQPRNRPQPVTTLSRSLMYSVRISCRQSCGPVSAAIAAFCTIDVGFEVLWLCSFCMAAITGAGPSAYPSRQPVMA